MQCRGGKIRGALALHGISIRISFTNENWICRFLFCWVIDLGGKCATTFRTSVTMVRCVGRRGEGEFHRSINTTTRSRSIIGLRWCGASEALLCICQFIQFDWPFYWLSHYICPNMYSFWFECQSHANGVCKFSWNTFLRIRIFVVHFDLVFFNGKKIDSVRWMGMG